MKKISHLFEKSASQRESQTAILSAGCAISYKQLNAYAQAISDVICMNEVSNGMVALMLPSGIDYIASLIGVNKSGNIFLPLDIHLPLNRKKRILEHAEVAILVTDKAGDEMDRNLHFKGLIIQLELITANTLQLAVIKAQETKKYAIELDAYVSPVVVKKQMVNPNAYLIYTSGSTGEPKAILGRNDSLCHFINWEIKRFKLQGIISGMLTNIGFDVSFRDIFVPLLAGGQLIIPDKATKENMHQLARWIAENKIELLHIVPSVFRLLTQSVTEKFDHSLKYLLFAGEALYWKDIKTWQEKNKNASTQFINLYGPSETTLAKLYYKIPAGKTKQAGEIVPLGKPISDTEVFIADNGKMCGEEEPGEIYIATKYPSNGYYKASALNKQAFITLKVGDSKNMPVYKTGDTGYLKNGNVVFSGRKDSQLKIAGNRVELSEVEITLQNYKPIKTACVIADQRDKENPLIVAFYSAPAALNKKDIVAFSQELLPAYMIPHHIHYLEAFPLTLNGKTDKNALHQLHRELLDKEIKQTPEQVLEIEEKFYSIIKNVLRLNQFYPDKTLMEVGGSSLKAIQIIVEIYKHYRVTLPVPFLLSNTFQNVFKHLKSQAKEALPETQVTPTAEEAPMDVTPSQEQLLYVSKVSRNSSLAYNVFLTYKVTGSIDPDKVKDAVVSVKDRYDIFRTTYAHSNNCYKQKVHPVSDDQTVFELFSLTEKEVDAFLEKEYAHEFDLEKEVPMLRVKMLRIAPKIHYIIFSTHHITVDVWSLQILMRDFVNYYMTGKLYPSDFTQYSEFVRTYTAVMSEQRKEQSRLFWKTLFDSRSNFYLPSDFARPEIREFKGAMELISLDDELSSKLLNYTNRHNMTLFMFYLSSLSLLLKKHSGSEEVRLGTPVSLRDVGARFNDSVGYFLNMLPVKIKIDSAATLDSYFEQIKDSMLQMYEYKYYSFSSIVRNLPYRYASNRNPLFDHMVVEIEQAVSRADNRSTNIQGPVFQLKRINDYSSKYDLTFFIIRTGNKISLSMEYDIALYRKETVRFFLNQQVKNLEQIVNAPEGFLIQDLLFDEYEFKFPGTHPVNGKEKEESDTRSSFLVSPTVNLEILEKLRKIIRQFIPNIMEDKNFFEQGIDSIQSLRVISKINQEFDTGIIILDLWTHNNVPDLALLITQKKEFSEMLEEEGQTTII